MISPTPSPRWSQANYDYRSWYHGADVSEQEASIPSQLPALYVLLTQISDPRYRLRYPLLLAQEISEGGEIVVSDKVKLNLYGVGETIQEAVDEYVSMLVDLFEELVDSEDILSCRLRERLQVLRFYLTPRQAIT